MLFLDYEGMDESIETLTYFKAKDQFVTNSSSQSTYMECFRLNVANNDLVEGNKTVVLGLASPTGVIILSPERADSQATITIVDDDRKCEIYILQQYHTNLLAQHFLFRYDVHFQIMLRSLKSIAGIMCQRIDYQ